MTPIVRLRALGYALSLDGDRIRYTLAEGHPEPHPATLVPILADLKTHREEALAALRAEADRPPVDPAGLCPPCPFPIYSRTLDAEVWIVPDSWRDPVPGPAYTHAEVTVLDRQRPDPEALRAIHAVKLAVDGEVVT